MSVGRPLPMLGARRETDRGPGPPDPAIEPGSTRPDPERIRDGWKHRFVAAGARADEMIALYRELGYEVAADPVHTHTLADGCVACFSSGPDAYRSIYTRRPAKGILMHETHPTRVLREEHQQILGVAGALERLLSEEPSRLDYDRLDKCIRFVRLFADACHHRKEEDLLFPALVDEGLPGDSGPIAVMLHEHRLGRELAGTMAREIDAARRGDAPACGRLVRAGRDYVALIRGHILKEDHVLFDMADQMVTGSRCTRLCEAYDGTAGLTYGGCTKVELEALGREILGPS